METILVAGATGQTGKEIISILKDSPDYNPLALIRKKEQKATFDEMNVDTVLADLEGDLSEAVKGVDRVIFAAGSGSKTPPQKTTDIDQNGAINLIDASKAAGVKKFVMLSAMRADRASEASEGMHHYMEAKKNADDHLKESSLAYTIVRPGHLTMDEKTNKIEAKEHLKESGKISRKDVAQVLVDSLPSDSVQNKIFEIIGGKITIKQALKDFT